MKNLKKSGFSISLLRLVKIYILLVLGGGDAHSAFFPLSGYQFRLLEVYRLSVKLKKVVCCKGKRKASKQQNVEQNCVSSLLG